MKTSTTEPLPAIVVTGRGVVSAIGASSREVEENLVSARGGIHQHDHLMPGCSIYAALANDFEPIPELVHSTSHGCDRTAHMAASAVAQALSESGLWDGKNLALPRERVALLLGSSHGGRSQLDRFVEAGMEASQPDLARGVLERGAHHHQTSVLAAHFGIHGPVATLSTACSSSGMAISYGIELLNSGEVDAVIAGGADAFSKLTYAGFTALGAMADGPCGPFGNTIGITLGEGAAFLLLERQASAHERDIPVLGQLYSCDTSWDGYHLTAPEPSGDGMRRAIQGTLKRGRVAATVIDYINAHATGTRAQDVSETLAIRRAFDTHAVPPVSATKSFTGHTLGASSVLGLLVGLASTRTRHIPPTLNFDQPRAGCDLDYVPRKARPVKVERFLAQSAAFGGANCVIAAGRHDPHHASLHYNEEAIVITGMGVISPLGCGTQEFFEAALDGRFANDPCEDDALVPYAPRLARVANFDPRKHLPRGKARRMNRISQYALAATEQALEDASLTERHRQGKNVGLMVGLCRGAAESFETYMRSVEGAQWDKANPTAFPNLVMSSVGGQISIAAGLKGIASTVVGGSEIGFTLLSVAAEHLRRRTDITAVVVVVADELSPLYLQLDHARRGGVTSLPPAEGAVALVLERANLARQRSIRVRTELAGWAHSSDAAPGPGLEEQGHWLEYAARRALERAQCDPSDVALVTSLARGESDYDKREAKVLARLFGGDPPPVSAMTGNIGLAEAGSGLYAVATAILALQNQRLPAPATHFGQTLGTPWLQDMSPIQGNVALVLGSGEFGGNGGVVLRRGQENLPA